MADIDAEIARLQAQLASKRMEVAAIRQDAQPEWADDDDDYSEESYYEEEIIEEYSDEEWEDEVVEEIFEEEIVEEETEYTEVEVSCDFTPIQQVPAVATPASQKPLTTRRPWQPAGSKVAQPISPAPAAPVVRKWSRPAGSASPTPPPPASKATGPSWAAKNQIQLKKTPVPVISSTGSEPKNVPPPAPTASAPVISQPPLAPGAKPIPRKRNKVRPPPGANGIAPVKNARPPGPEFDAKPKGGRVRIIDWAANRRTNNEIQKATQPNFKGEGSLPEDKGPAKVKRNYVIPENVRKPPGADNAAAGAAAPAPSGHKRRTIPDVPISPPGSETLWEKLLGPKLIANSKLQKKNTSGCMKDQELIGLYFGCKMKAECKYFHPRLQDFYFSASSQQKNLEIVYVSSDRSLNEFKDVFARMPYLALPGGTARYKNQLSQSLKIIEQPTLVILDDEGMVVTVDAANQILALERGNVEQAVALIDRWQKTRPVTFEQIQRDFALQHGKLQRGILYWQE